MELGDFINKLKIIIFCCLFIFSITVIADSNCNHALIDFYPRKKILFITQMYKDTLGDLYGLGKLIAYLKNKDKFDIFVLIKTNKSAKDIKILNFLNNYCKGIKVFLTPEFDRRLYVDMEMKNLIEDSRIILFPAYDYLKNNKLLNIINKFSKYPVIIYSEYDFNVSDFVGLPENVYHCMTGFGDPLSSGLGFFINQNLKDVKNINYIVHNVKSINFLKNLYNINIPIKNLLNLKRIHNKYLKKNNLFFGYNNTCKVSYKGIGIFNYITIAIKKTLLQNRKNNDRNNDKNIDIIANIEKLEVAYLIDYIKALDPQGAHFASINFYKYQKDEIKLVTKKTIGNGSLNIRIMNIFPIDHYLFEWLQINSDPFVAATGDQSFSEGISNNKLIAYQIMSWKEDLFERFVEYIKLNKNLYYLLYDFYNNQLLFETNTLLYNNKIVEMLVNNQNKLLTQAKKLRAFLMKDMPLYKNLYKGIKSDFFELGIDGKLFSIINKKLLNYRIYNIENENERVLAFTYLLEELINVLPNKIDINLFLLDSELQEIYSNLLYYSYVVLDNKFALHKQIYLFVNRIICLYIHS